MRWDALRLDDSAPDGPAGGDASLPLFERGAIVRTFDTPGFRGMTFYEVQARSIVNRVPESSRMPFRWTINPYRGCQHACTYCTWGQTPILMADGRTKPLADLRVGDAIYGTERDGFCRRYVTTTVLAHWRTVKPAYRVSLEDGTQLIASGDHRFLTERGWKHVTGEEHGPLQRPFLTVSSKLMGVGGFAEPPKESRAYRRGYLCGMIRGDGHPGSYVHSSGPGEEALRRSRYYLGTFGILTSEFDQHLIDWPTAPCEDWRKGFLAGIFDAEGSYSHGIWRVASTDPRIVRWTAESLASSGFDYAVEPSGRPNGLTYVRLRGGLREALRFFHATDPASTRKRSIDGVALESDAKLRVAEIQPLGFEMPMYDITTGTGDFIANGVVSHNCFARKSHTYLDLDAGHDFDSKVIVKVNAPELLRRKLASPGWHGEHIAMGTNVDCYQRAEGRYRLMRGIIAALRDAANPFSILTKGTLILRDLDLLLEAAEVTEVGLNVSAAFVDKALWRAIEPGTPAPERRLEVCASLTEAGLRCGVLMGPIVPFLSDSLLQIDAAVRRIAEAGATHVTPIVLHLRPGTREWFMSWLRATHPELTDRYAAMYGRGSYARKDYQARISAQVGELAERYGVGRGQRRGGAVAPRDARRVGTQAREAPPDGAGHGPRPAGVPAAEQLTLL